MVTLNDLYELAENASIEIDDVPTRALVSASFPEGYILIDTSKLETRADEAVRLAHELGHCATGSFYNIYSPFDIIGRHEHRANAWAIKKLVPKDELTELYGQIDANDIDIAEYFGVTLEFLHKAIEYYDTVA